VAGMTVEEAKLYLRVDTDADDTLIQGLLTAAATYIYGQTGKTKYTKRDGTIIDIEQEELYSLCLNLLLAHWYENRGVQINGTVTAKVEHSVDALINHIATCGDYT
jgi:uncharacterized phage protein (predicted DNA packaging)